MRRSSGVVSSSLLLLSSLVRTPLPVPLNESGTSDDELKSLFLATLPPLAASSDVS